MKKISLLIADDHTLVRQSWAFILNNNPRFEVIGEATSGEQAVEMTRKLRPDVIIMDINMPGISGMEATRLICLHSPATAILAVSLHTKAFYVQTMMQEGALGYVTKNSPREEMFTAIEAVSTGKKYICSEIKNILTEQLLSPLEKPAGLSTLSKREQEVVQHVKQGSASKDIATGMGLSVKTVEVHRHNILRKLNLKNTAALVHFMNTNR